MPFILRRKEDGLFLGNKSGWRTNGWTPDINKARVRLQRSALAQAVRAHREVPYVVRGYLPPHTERTFVRWKFSKEEFDLKYEIIEVEVGVKVRDE